MTDTLRHRKNQDSLDTTAGIAVKGKDGVLLMEAGKDIHLTGATLEALGDNGSLILHFQRTRVRTACRVKQSGLLSSGGLGFTIRTEKRKDQYSDADML